MFCMLCGVVYWYKVVQGDLDVCFVCCVGVLGVCFVWCGVLDVLYVVWVT